MKIFQFLQEDNGVFSSVRLLMFLSVLMFCLDWLMHIVHSTVYDPPYSIIGFMFGIFSMKVVQKFAEVNTPTEKSVDINAETIKQ